MKFLASNQITDTEFISYNHLHGNISLFYINKEIVYWPLGKNQQNPVSTTGFMIFSFFP